MCCGANTPENEIQNCILACMYISYSINSCNGKDRNISILQQLNNHYSVQVIVFLEFGPRSGWEDVFVFFFLVTVFFCILAFAAASRSALLCSRSDSSMFGSIYGWSSCVSLFPPPPPPPPSLVPAEL